MQQRKLSLAELIIGAYLPTPRKASFNIRKIRILAQNVPVLRAIAGTRSPGQTKLNPYANTIQTLTAVKHKRQWQIELFQNTPAQFRERPEWAQHLREEWSQL